MTEAERLEPDDPQKMLLLLTGETSRRKLRLFGCACVQRIHLLCWPDEQPSGIAEITERFADGCVTFEEFKDVKSRFGARGGISSKWAVNCGEFALFDDDSLSAVTRVIDAADWFFRLHAVERIHQTTGVWEKWNCPEAIAGRREGFHELARYIRDLFVVPLDGVTPGLPWLTPSVARLAQSICDDRDFERMPELADALEQTGGADADILSHCRGSGPHVRGCWVVDLALGKK